MLIGNTTRSDFLAGSVRAMASSGFFYLYDMYDYALRQILTICRSKAPQLLVTGRAWGCGQWQVRNSSTVHAQPINDKAARF
jgi:hypothetical protein